MKKLFLFNSLIIPIKQERAIVEIKKVDVDEVKKIIQSHVEEGYEIISAIGHKSTADVLSQLLSIEVPTNRIFAQMEQGDIGIHFTLNTRLEEGRVLSKEELREILDKCSFYYTIVLE